MGELLVDSGCREVASEYFRKVPNQETRIELLIAYDYWKPAIQEMLETKLYEDYEDRLIITARQKGQSWVESEYLREKDRMGLR